MISKVLSLICEIYIAHKFFDFSTYTTTKHSEWLFSRCFSCLCCWWQSRGQEPPSSPSPLPSLTWSPREFECFRSLLGHFWCYPGKRLFLLLSMEYQCNQTNYYNMHDPNLQSRVKVLFFCNWKWIEQQLRAEHVWFLQAVVVPGGSGAAGGAGAGAAGGFFLLLFPLSR